MAQSLLGDVIDLHSGGEDNIFPHHECEIAQSCSANGAKTFSRYWFHTRHLIVEGEKMSKSKSNFFTVRDLLAKGYSPAAIRLRIISSKYREQSNFTFQGLTDSQRDIDRWLRLKRFLEDAIDAKPKSDGPPGPLSESLREFKAALASDLNIAGAIGVLNKAVGRYNTNEEPPAIDLPAELDALDQMNSVLGVLDLQTQGEAKMDRDEAATITAKIADRNAARTARDFKRSDQIRDELLAMGIEIKDGPQGTTWTRIVK
jgi:cysteinyl-tRNA synthetase